MAAMYLKLEASAEGDDIEAGERLNGELAFRCNPMLSLHRTR